MRRATAVIGIVIASVLLFATVAVRAQDTTESIRAFSADVTVRDDGSISVIERIDYFLPTARRGILRRLPIKYRADDGTDRSVKITIAGVTDESGASVPYEATRDGNRWLDLEIGDADKTVDGLRTYIISYEAIGALRYFDDHDELYWDAIGAGWEVPIDRAVATVRLPAAVPAESVTFKCFTGPEGSAAQDCLANRQANIVSFAADGPLTVTVGWKPGIVRRIEAPEVTWWSGVDWQWWVLLAVAIIAAVKVGRYVSRRT